VSKIKVSLRSIYSYKTGKIP